MPKSPKKPCAFPGCPNLSEGRYCEVHKKIVDKRYEVYERNKETKRKYGRSWKKIRKRYVASHPFCEECLKKGILVPVDEVHHIIPLADGGTHDDDNLMSLCKTCHAKIHGSRGDYKESKSFQVYDYEK